MSENNSIDSACCAGCVFWAHQGDKPWADCRRYPPRVIDSMVDQDMLKDGAYDPQGAALEATRFPITLEDHWCGEFQPSHASAHEAKSSNGFVDLNADVSTLFESGLFGRSVNGTRRKILSAYFEKKYGYRYLYGEKPRPCDSDPYWDDKSLFPIRELLKMSAEDLYEARGLGNFTFKCIVDALNHVGLKLSAHTPR